MYRLKHFRSSSCEACGTAMETSLLTISDQLSLSTTELCNILSSGHNCSQGEHSCSLLHFRFADWHSPKNRESRIILCFDQTKRVFSQRSLITSIVVKATSVQLQRNILLIFPRIAMTTFTHVSLTISSKRTIHEGRLGLPHICTP